MGAIGTCPVGAHVKGLYCFIQTSSNFQAANVDWYFSKQRSGQSNITDFPSPGATGNDPLRNQIYHEEKGIPGDSGDTSPLTFRGVLRIPRLVQRMRAGDNLFFKFRGSLDYNVCMKIIFKWYI